MFTSKIEIPVDDIIADIAKNQKVIISPDDPIFTAVYLNKHLIDLFLDEFNRNSQTFVDAINQKLETFDDKQKTLMRNQVEEYAPFLEKALHEVADKEVKEFTSLMASQLSEFRDSQAKQIRTQQRLAVISVLTCMMSIASLCGVFWILGN